MKRRDLLLGSAALLAGCGGGSGSKTSSGPGRAVFTIEWPRGTTRLIPAASQSIAVEIRQNGNLLARQVLARPGTTLTFADLPEGDLTAFAAAYPTTDGTGVPQASGTVPIAIVDGQTVQVPLTMASTIASFVVSPATLGIGEIRRLTATAKDASGATVLMPGSQLSTQITGGAANVTFDPIFWNLTGVSAGNVTVRVTDPESGVSSNATIAIGTAAPARPNPVTLPYMPILSGDSVSYLIWSAPEGTSTLQAIDPDTGMIVYQTQAPGVIRQLKMSTDSTTLYCVTSNLDLFRFDIANQTWTASATNIERVFSNLPGLLDSLLVTRNGKTTVVDNSISRPLASSIFSFRFNRNVDRIVHVGFPISAIPSLDIFTITDQGVNFVNAYPNPLNMIPVYVDSQYYYAIPREVRRLDDSSFVQNFTNSLNTTIFVFADDKSSDATYGICNVSARIHIIKFTSSPLAESGFVNTSIPLTGTNIQSADFLGKKRIVITVKADSNAGTNQVFVCDTP